MLLLKHPEYKEIQHSISIIVEKILYYWISLKFNHKEIFDFFQPVFWYCFFTSFFNSKAKNIGIRFYLKI